MNKQTLSVFILLAFSISMACAEETRQHTFDAQDFRTLEIRNTVGEVFIESSESDQVELRLIISEQGERGWFRRKPDISTMDIRSSSRTDKLSLTFEEKNAKTEWYLKVPTHLSLAIQQGVGTIEVSNLQNNADIELGVGTVEVTAAADVIGAIDLNAGVGDTSITGARDRSQRRALVSSTSSAYGDGTRSVKADVGVGDVTVSLQ